MNIKQLAENVNKHKYHKGQFFGKQGMIVFEYILNKVIKYKGEFFELNQTISDNTGVSVRTVQRTVKRMAELSVISVAPRRKVCPVTGKTVQSSNLIKILVYKAFKVINDIIVGKAKEVVSSIEVVEEITDEPIKPKKPFYKKSIRVEQVPTWLGQEYVKPEETDDIKKQREELEKLLGRVV